MTNLSKKVLVVEDSKSYLFVLTESLRSAGIGVSTAENGEEGLEAVQAQKPDLILLDITMPKMDGLTMAKKLRELGVSTPIIFLTNMSDLKNVSEGMQSAKDYIVKADTSTDEVVAIVKERLGLK